MRQEQTSTITHHIRMPNKKKKNYKKNRVHSHEDFMDILIHFFIIICSIFISRTINESYRPVRKNEWKSGEIKL